MPRYRVVLGERMTQYRTVEVEAESMSEADDLALDGYGSEVYNMSSSVHCPDDFDAFVHDTELVDDAD